MRPFTPRYIQQTVNILSRPATLQFARTQPLNQTQQATMSSGLNIENTNIKTAPGVSLESNQKTLVGSVLDLFAGRPSLEKLQLWADDGVFEDPITIAQGRKQYEAQWVCLERFHFEALYANTTWQYGLQSAFSEIERLSHEVTSSGNPISMNLKTRYVVKGIGKEQTISSVINIFHNDQGKITKVEDKWDGKLPESSIVDVSYFQLANPLWWAFYTWAWLFWLWSFVWWSKPWLVRTSFLLGRFDVSLLLVEMKADFFLLLGFPSTQLGSSAQDDQRSQEQGGGCSERQLETILDGIMKRDVYEKNTNKHYD